MNTNGDYYLGRIFDSQSGQTTDQPLLYDPDDLTTHAVVVGMTGSGKTESFLFPVLFCCSDLDF